MFTTRPEILGTFGCRHLDALARARRRAWPCWRRAATPSTPAPPPPSCCRWSSRIWSAPAATCRWCSIRPRPEEGRGAVRAGRRPRTAPPSRPIKALGLDLMPGSGLLATVVPGAFGGWMMLLRDHGRLPLREVLEPAIGYFENGHPMLPRVCRHHRRPDGSLHTANGRPPARSTCPAATVPEGQASCSATRRLAET